MPGNARKRAQLLPANGGTKPPGPVELWRRLVEGSPIALGPSRNHFTTILCYPDDPPLRGAARTGNLSMKHVTYPPPAQLQDLMISRTNLVAWRQNQLDGDREALSSLQAALPSPAGRGGGHRPAPVCKVPPPYLDLDYHGAVLRVRRIGMSLPDRDFPSWYCDPSSASPAQELTASADLYLRLPSFGKATRVEHYVAQDKLAIATATTILVGEFSGYEKASPASQTGHIKKPSQSVSSVQGSWTRLPTLLEDNDHFRHASHTIPWSTHKRG